jgi:glutaredoxin
MTAPITVYITRPAAPLCERVCDFLAHRGYSYTTVDIVTDADRELLRQETGYSSCPVVVVAGHVIGKLQDTIEAERTGRLAALITDIES